MSRYVDIDTLGIGPANPDVFRDRAYADGWNAAIKILDNCLKNIPAADVAPVRHGRWIIGEPGIIGVPIHCSKCGWGSNNADQKKWMKYPGHKSCGACGALMDGGQGND